MNTNVILPFDGKQWGDAKLHRSDGPPFEHIRTLLKGRWTRSEGHIGRDGAAAFWNASNGRRVLVMTEATARKLALEPT